MKALRKLYRRVAMAGTHREIELSGQVGKFYTPTPAVEEMVVLMAKEKDYLLGFLQELKRGDIFWDIGGNIGIYSIFSAHRIGQGGKVFSFEPEKKNRTLLERNLKLNQLSNVTSLPYALGDEDGEAILYPSAGASIGKHSLIFRTDKKLKPQGLAVPLRKGDSLVQQGQIPPPTVVKLDVEGGELKVLRGMTETLRHPALRFIQCEVHLKVLKMAGLDPAEVETIFKQSGFAISTGGIRGSDLFMFGRK